MGIRRAKVPGKQELVKPQDACLPKALLLQEPRPSIGTMQGLRQHQTTEDGEFIVKRDLGVFPESGR